MSHRYAGFPVGNAVVVLDQATGEVVCVSEEGCVTWRAAQTSAAQPETQAAPKAAVPALVAGMPSPIASTYARMIEAPRPQLACRHLVDCFTVVLKTWALTLAAQYLQSDLNDARLNEMLARDFQRPLISAWSQFTHRALAVFRGAGVEPFFRELPEAFDRLELKCKDWVLASSTYQDEAGRTKTRVSKLGKVTALIKFRNGLAHGYDSSDALAREQLEKYRPVLEQVLAACGFLREYSFELDPRGVVLVAKRGGSLALAPLVDRADEGDTLLWFEGATKTTLVYASPEVAPVERGAAAETWRALLARKPSDLPLVRLDEMNEGALLAAAGRVTGAAIDELLSSRRFLPGETIVPKSAKRLVEEFALSGCRALVAAGDTGSGKTTLLVSTALGRAQAGDVVLFYRCAALRDVDLQSRILRDLGVRDAFFEDFLEMGARVFGEGRGLTIVFDGLNEFGGDLSALVASFDALVRQASDCGWLRVFASIGKGTWERLREDARFGRLEGARYFTTEVRAGVQTRRVPYAELAPLDEDEVEEIWKRLRSSDELRLRPTTSFDELRGSSTAALLRNPLMLRLVASAYDGRPVPRDITSDEAMRMYFEHVVLEQQNPSGPRFERAAVLRAIAAELDSIGAESIARSALEEVPALRRTLRAGEQDSAYLQLLDLGALSETWDEDRCLVRFQSQRLLELLLADLHAPSCADAVGVLALATRARRFDALRGALVTILARAGKSGREELFGQTLLRAAGTPATAEAAVDVIGAAIETLARSEPDALPKVLASVLAQRSVPGARALFAAFDALFARGETGAAAILPSTLEIADALGAKALVAEAALRRGLFAQHRGELDEALAAYEAARDAAATAGEQVLTARASVKRAEIFRLRDRPDEAAAALEGAAERLRAIGAAADAAEAKRQLAIATQGRSDARAHELAECAVAWADESGDALVQAMSRLTAGTGAWRLGLRPAARAHWSRALEIATQAGLTRAATFALSNLGFVDREEGDLAAAVARSQKLLEMGLRTGERLWTALAYGNLGSFELERGNLADAESFFSRAADLSAELGTPVAEAAALVALAHVRSCRSEDPAPILSRADAAAARSDDPSARLQCLWAKLVLARRNARPDAALERELVDLASEHDPSSLQARAVRLASDASLSTAEVYERVCELAAELRDASPKIEVFDLPTVFFADVSRRLRAVDARASAHVAELGLALAGDRPTPDAKALDELARGEGHWSLAAN